MEAFQMSLGREADIDIDPNDGDGAIELTGTLASQGQILFLDAAEEDIRCHSCHKNAGANANFDFPPGTLDTNANFNTGVERLPDPAYRMVAYDIPCDAGFGNGVDIGLTGPCADVVTTGNSRAFGDGTFNTPPLIEAADTAPFFHNHSVNTIEGAVAFYNSDTFNNSPAAAFGRNISLTIPQVDAIAAFLRVLNALENIRNSLLIETNALAGINAVPKAYDVDNLVHVAYAEVEDAISGPRGRATAWRSGCDVESSVTTA